MFKTHAIVAFALAVSSGVMRAEDPRPRSPQEVFEARIMPIFKSPHPASCVQCHLAGVDLKNYILPSHEQTFASLRDQGLIDLAEPGKSKILTLIAMGDKDADAGARRIHEKARKAEYEAFADWVAACCDDPKLRDLPRLAPEQRATPPRPDAVIRHARKSRVVDSFERNVWSQRMRCFPCHTPHELDPKDPKHELSIEKHKDFLSEENGAYADRMVLFRKTPEETVNYLIEKSQRAVAAGELPLINLKEPTKSLLVLKPTAKLPPRKEGGGFERPTYVAPVSHMGGLKIHVDDQSYKAFVAWIRDYARVVGDEYKTVADLPPDNWIPTKNAVILRDVPASWPDRSRVQFFVYAWDAKRATWETEPAAFTQGLLNPRRNAAGLLFLFGPVRAASETAKKSTITISTSSSTSTAKANPTLPPGKYLIKVYFDRNNRLSEDPTVFLGEAEFAGQVEIRAKWGEGFPKAEPLSGKMFK